MEDKDLKTENLADNDNETQNVEVTVDENKDVKADVEKENKVEEKPLTDDELYTKIQTEKLLKKKKVKNNNNFTQDAWFLGYLCYNIFKETHAAPTGRRINY